MVIDEAICKAFKMIDSSKSDEQLRSSNKFIQFLKKNYPKVDVTNLLRAVKEKDKKLHEK